MMTVVVMQAAQLNQQKSLYEAVFDQHLSAAGMCTCDIYIQLSLTNNQLFPFWWSHTHGLCLTGPLTKINFWELYGRTFTGQSTA